MADQDSVCICALLQGKKGKGGGLKGKKLGGTQPVVQSNRTKAPAKPRNSKTIKQVNKDHYNRQTDRQTDRQT